jgi:hypothetical protein
LWSWLHGIWIYNYLCNQCLSPLTLWVRIQFWARSTRYNIMWLNLSVTCDRSVHGFLWVLTNKNDWDIVESGVKHHNQTNILDTNSRTYVLRFVNPRFHSSTNAPPKKLKDLFYIIWKTIAIYLSKLRIAHGQCFCLRFTGGCFVYHKYLGQNKTHCGYNIYI